MCAPFGERGLGIRNLASMNGATLAKLAWDMVQSTSGWALLMRKRFLKDNSPTKTYSSSIWPGLKHLFVKMPANAMWLVNDGGLIF